MTYKKKEGFNEMPQQEDGYNVQARTAAVETDVQSMKGHINSLDTRLGQVEKALTAGFDEVKTLVMQGKSVSWPLVLATVGLVLSVGVFLRNESQQHVYDGHLQTQAQLAVLERDIQWILKLEKNLPIEAP
jgi:hypothetical protein